jgi:protein CpxP
MIMNKTKLLSFAVIALLLLNFGILGFLFLSKDKQGQKNKKMPKEIVINKLHFDDNQIIEYEKIIKVHRNTITTIDDSIKVAKNELYQLLNSETINLEKKDSLYSKLANYQRQVEITHFNHFLEIKAICKKEQLADYKTLTEELSKIFTYGRKPKNE